MDSDMMDDSVFELDNESDAYSPEPKPKAKAAPKKAAAPKAAPKKATKLVQTKLNVAAKKRPKPAADDETDDGEVRDLSQTPPSAKKQKKAPAKKARPASQPLAEIANDSVGQLDGGDDNNDGDFDDGEAADGTPASAPKSKKSASEMYQKLTPLEHIIKRPDTYIGSVEHMEQSMWVFNKQTTQMERRTVSYVPGLYKIFDEILVNAADNKQRDPGMTMLKVTVNRETGEISVENNGKGIPVAMHSTEKVYIPEMLFGHLLTGSNYDDNEKKTVGGRNGYGAKLCNVFSTEFTLECQDSANGKRYKQTWRNNMSIMEKAKITSNKSSDFVRVTFTPDYKRFNMPNGIDDDLEALLYRRIYDMAGVVDGVKVFLNGEHLKVGFKKYCDMYAQAIAKERDEEVVGELPPTASVQFEDPKAHKRWQIGFTVSDGTFQQVSFVNSIATTSGGTHVNYIADQICNALLNDLNKRKKGHSLKLSHIRNHIFIFVNCFIDNPAFNSQTKEQMTTKVSAFGSKCHLTDGFIKKIRSTDAINNIIHFAEKKADKMMAKSDGNKRSRISNDKLVDANLAGTKHGHECTLILTEGDSARGLAVAGRAILDPDRIGVFPLRGKLLNVRDASIDQITKNKEIQNIKQFLGLKHKQVYTDTKSLRYGHLMIMADQDHDGSHIKGLLINFLQVQFPSLLQIPEFFQEFITPVVKIWQGPNPKKPVKTKAFYTIPEYDEWKESHSQEVKKWEHKYLKGLGSSSNEDAQVYFTNLDAHLKEFHTMHPEEAQLFDLAFSKKKADARKEWLGNFIPGTFLDQSTKSITYSDFVNKELILFSMADNLRSIPSVLDGFKPGQRKVIYTCFKKNIVKDQKVFELAGMVSKMAAYHHGDASLHQTIVGLAQNFVGSNNVNCLEPSGNFGSRLSGGSDAASARYIFTRLSPFARRVFNPLDEPVLENNIDEGSVIEPVNYAPVVPMVLINGADGIGTGWSTQIPNYNPVDIVRNLKRRMGRLEGGTSEELPFEPMVPWFRGWKNTPEPEPNQPGKFRFNGIVFPDDKSPNEVVVTELPVRMWTDDFKSRLEDVIRAEKSPSWIKDYKEFNDHRNVHFVIQLDEKHMKAAVEEGLIERFKLSKTIGTTNLVAFDKNGQIRRYEKVEDIMEEFYNYRFNVYTLRKNYWLGVYHQEFSKLQNQYRFVLEIMEGKLVVSKKKKAIVVQELRDRNYVPFPKDTPETKKNKTKDDDDNNNNEEDDDDDNVSARDYDYLLSMPIWSFTQERLDRLKKQIEAKKEQYDVLESKSEKDLWCADLDEFLAEWENQLRLDAEIQTTIRRMGRRTSKKIGAGRGRKVRDDDDYSEKKPARAPKASAAKAAPKAAPKPVEKTSQRFAEMFSAKPKPKEPVSKATGDGGADDFDDDDFEAIAKPRSKPASAAVSRGRVVELDDDEEEDEGPIAASEIAGGRTKRAAATKAKKWTIDSDSDMEDDDDDEDMLDDVGAMVKGIGQEKPAASSASDRVSLFSMSRPETSQADSTGGSGGSSLPKISRPKAFKAFDFDEEDDTNYEALAFSSPRKSVAGDEFKDDDNDDNDDNDDDDDDVRPSSKVSTVSTLAKKGRGRPAGPKISTAKADKTGQQTADLSPAAKAYAAKRASARAALFLSDDDDDDEFAAPVAKPAAKSAAKTAKAAPAAKAVKATKATTAKAAKSAPAAKPAPKRAARATATATKKKPVYVDNDDDDDDDLGRDESDVFDVDFD